MNKKITSSVLAALLVAGSTSFSALAAMANGTVVIGTKAFDLAYANNPANAAEITNAVVAANGAIFVKDFEGNWINNVTGLKVLASAIPAVTYKSATGVETKFDAADKDAVTTVVVTSVSTNNLKQIVVNFNTTVDKTSAETIGNYKLDNSTLAATSVAQLQEDGKTVVVTLQNAISTNASEHDFAVSGVKNLTAVKMVDYTTKFTAFDNIIPQASGVKLVGPTTVEVSFSEPIVNAAAINVLVDNGVYGANVTGFKAGTNNKVVLVTLGTSLTNAQVYTLKITGAVDFAGFAAPQKDFALTYVKDVTGPVVSIKSATQESVTVNFSKAVKNLSNASFYHTFATWNPISVTDVDGNVVNASNYYDQVKVNFTSTSDPTLNRALPEGVINFTTVAGITGSEIQDQWGNKMSSDVTLPVTVSADRIAPVVNSVKAIAEDKIELAYSEDVISADNAANFVVTDKDGKAVTGFSAAYTSVNKVYKTTITFDGPLDAGSYTVKIKNVADKSLYANKVTETTLAFNITDLTAPVSAVGKVVGANTVYVTFNEAMATSGTHSVLDKSNYRLDGAVLADEIKIVAFDAKTVKLTGFVASPAGKMLVVRNVSDVAGNVLDLFDNIQLTLANDSAPQITATKTTALNMVKITVNQPLKSVNASSLFINGFTAAAATFVNNDNGTATITATLNAGGALADGSSTSVLINVISTGIVSMYGTPVVIANNVQQVVTDGIAPKVKTVTFVSATQIKVLFSEDLNVDTLAVSGKNGFTVAGGTLTSALLATDDVITLTGTGFTANTDVIFSGTNVTDVSGNSLATFSRTDALTVVTP